MSLPMKDCIEVMAMPFWTAFLAGCLLGLLACILAVAVGLILPTKRDTTDDDYR